MKTYDSYSEVDMGTLVITFGIIDGDGRWVWWDDTGWEFEETKSCKVEFVEAFDLDGDPVVPSKELLEEAEQIAEQMYWSNLMEGSI